MQPEPRLNGDPPEPDAGADTAPVNVCAALRNQSLSEKDEKDENGEASLRNFMRMFLATITCDDVPNEAAFRLRTAVNQDNPQAFLDSSDGVVAIANKKWGSLEQRPIVMDTLKDDIVEKMLVVLAAQDDAYAFSVLRKSFGKLTWAYDPAAMAEIVASRFAKISRFASAVSSRTTADYRRLPP